VIVIGTLVISCPIGIIFAIPNIIVDTRTCMVFCFVFLHLIAIASLGLGGSSVASLGSIDGNRGGRIWILVVTVKVL